MSNLNTPHNYNSFQSHIPFCPSGLTNNTYESRSHHCGLTGTHDDDGIHGLTFYDYENNYKEELISPTTFH